MKQLANSICHISGGPINDNVSVTIECVTCCALKPFTELDRTASQQFSS